VTIGKKFGLLAKWLCAFKPMIEVFQMKKQQENLVKENILIIIF